MKIEPYKRVGSPASLRGIRGEYLNSLLMWTAGSLLVIIIIISLPFPILIRLVLTGLIVLYFLYKFNELKKLSKGDLKLSLKKNCRKNLIFKKINEKSKN